MFHGLWLTPYLENFTSSLFVELTWILQRCKYIYIYTDNIVFNKRLFKKQLLLHLKIVETFISVCEILNGSNAYNFNFKGFDHVYRQIYIHVKYSTCGLYLRHLYLQINFVWNTYWEATYALLHMFIKCISNRYDFFKLKCKK